MEREGWERRVNRGCDGERKEKMGESWVRR